MGLSGGSSKQSTVIFTKKDWLEILRDSCFIQVLVPWQWFSACWICYPKSPYSYSQLFKHSTCYPCLNCGTCHRNDINVSFQLHPTRAENRIGSLLFFFYKKIKKRKGI